MHARIRAAVIAGAAVTALAVTGVPTNGYATAARPQAVQVTNNIAYAPAQPAGSRGHLLDVYLPSTPSGPRPLLIWTGGSAWMSDNGKASANSIASMFNPRGYAVAGVSVRSSSQAKFPAQVFDIKAAIRFLRANAGRFNLDPNRFAVAGDSSGGWEANMAAMTGGVAALEGTIGVTGVASAVQAGVAFFGPTDFLQMNTQRVPGGLDHDGANSPESRLMGCAIQTCPSQVAQANPVRYVDRNDPPMMLLHGQADPLVPHGQSVLLYNAIKAACGSVQFFSVPGAGHSQSDVLSSAHFGAQTVRTTSNCQETVRTGTPNPSWDVIATFLNSSLHVTAAASPAVTAPPGATASLPATFRWSSTGPLIGPKNDATHSLSAIKDPSVVFVNGRYHLFATTTSSTGKYSMVYLSFTDWAQAGAATQRFLDQTPIGTGYRAAPQIFYFAPRRLWYLIYQTGNDASYSTNPDIGNPAGWTAPRGFYGGMPQIIRDNIGGGFWVDMWVICDSATCSLFSSDDNGHLYRSQTSVSAFPAGMSQPVIAMQDAARHPLWEASNVYKVAGGNQYLLIVEAIGSAGRRYFRSWTATSISGPWTALANTQANPFAGAANVTFGGTAWTTDVSHGEMIRSGFDQTLTISGCRMQYLYQGRDPSIDTGSYSTLPWRLALLTQTNSTC